MLSSDQQKNGAKYGSVKESHDDENSKQKSVSQKRMLAIGIAFLVLVGSATLVAAVLLRNQGAHQKRGVPTGIGSQALDVASDCGDGEKFIRDTCVPCANTTAIQTLNMVNTDCPPKTYYDEVDTCACLPCWKHWCCPGGDVISPCPPGSYQPLAGQKTCKLAIVSAFTNAYSYNNNGPLTKKDADVQITQAKVFDRKMCANQADLGAPLAVVSGMTLENMNDEKISINVSAESVSLVKANILVSKVAKSRLQGFATGLVQTCFPPDAVTTVGYVTAENITPSNPKTRILRPNLKCKDGSPRLFAAMSGIVSLKNEAGMFSLSLKPSVRSNADGFVRPKVEFRTNTGVAKASAGLFAFCHSPGTVLTSGVIETGVVSETDITKSEVIKTVTFRNPKKCVPQVALGITSLEANGNSGLVVNAELLAETITKETFQFKIYVASTKVTKIDVAYLATCGTNRIQQTVDAVAETCLPRIEAGKSTTAKPTSPPKPKTTQAMLQVMTNKPTLKPTFRPTTQPTRAEDCIEIDCDTNPYQLKCLVRQICTEPFCEASGPKTLTQEFLSKQKDLFEKQCTSTCADILPTPKLIFSKDNMRDCSVSGTTSGNVRIELKNGQKNVMKEGEYFVFGKDTSKEQFDAFQYVNLKNTADGFPNVNEDFTLFVRFAIDKDNAPDRKYLPVVTKQGNGKMDWGIFVQVHKAKGKLEITFRSKMNFEITVAGTMNLRFDIISVAVTLTNKPNKRIIKLYENGRLLAVQPITQAPGIGQAETQDIKIGFNPISTKQIGQCLAETFYGYVMSFYIYNQALTEIDIFTTQTCVFRQEYISITNPHDMNFQSGEAICQANGYELARVTNEVSNIHALDACIAIDPIDCWLSGKMKNYTNYQGNGYKKEWCTVLLIENEAGKWVKRPCNMSQGVICGGYKNPCKTKAPTKKPTGNPSGNPTAQTGVPTPPPVPSPTANPSKRPTISPSTYPTQFPTIPPEVCNITSICVTIRSPYITNKNVPYRYMKWNTNGYIETVEKQIPRVFVDEYCKDSVIELTSDVAPTSEFDLDYSKSSLDFTGSVSAKLTNTKSLNKREFTFAIVMSLNRDGPKEKYMSVLSQESGVGMTKGWSFWISDVNGIGMIRLNYGGQELQGRLNANIYEPMKIVVTYKCETNMFEAYVNDGAVQLIGLTQVKSSCFDAEMVDIKVGGASASYKFGNCWDILQGKIYSIHFWAVYMKATDVKECVRLDGEWKIMTRANTKSKFAAVEGVKRGKGMGLEVVGVGGLAACVLCAVVGAWIKVRKREYVRV